MNPPVNPTNTAREPPILPNPHTNPRATRLASLVSVALAPSAPAAAVPLLALPPVWLAPLALAELVVKFTLVGF